MSQILKSWMVTFVAFIELSIILQLNFQFLKRKLTVIVKGVNSLDNNPHLNQKMISEEERIKANEFIVRFLQNVMNEGNNELTKLRLKLSVSY